MAKASWVDLIYNGGWAVFFTVFACYGVVKGELFIPVLEAGEPTRMYFRGLSLQFFIAGLLVMAVQLSLKPLEHFGLIAARSVAIKLGLFLVAIVLAVTSIRINGS